MILDHYVIIQLRRLGGGRKKNAKRSEVLPAVTDGINCNFKRKLNKEQFLNGNFLFSDRIPSNEISDSPLQNAPY